MRVGGEFERKGVKVERERMWEREGVEWGERERG